MPRGILRDTLLIAVCWAAVWDGAALLAELLAETFFALSLAGQLDPLITPALPGFGLGLVFALWNPRHTWPKNPGPRPPRYLLFRAALPGLLVPLGVALAGRAREPLPQNLPSLAGIVIALCLLSAVATWMLLRIGLLGAAEDGD